MCTQPQYAVQQVSELMNVPGVDIVGAFPPEAGRAAVFSAGILAASHRSRGRRATHRVPVVGRGRAGHGRLRPGAVDRVELASVERGEPRLLGGFACRGFFQSGAEARGVRLASNRRENPYAAPSFRHGMNDPLSFEVSEPESPSRNDYQHGSSFSDLLNEHRPRA